MNSNYTPHDFISLEFGKLNAARLREHPELLRPGRENIERWARLQGRVSLAYQEWLQIVEAGGLEVVLTILEGVTDNDQRLRSSTPFVGPPFVSEEERREVFAQYPRTGK